ncbi:MAG TPA: hypothetical protein VJQ78_01965 [Sphingobium sp.]|nr:hypothetical protein [Sphingobium sp.]
MFCLFLLAAAPTLPPVDEARRVIEWQLRAPPRTPDTSGLSPEEAQVLRQLYLQSIGQRPPQPSTMRQDR